MQVLSILFLARAAAGGERWDDPCRPNRDGWVTEPAHVSGPTEDEAVSAAQDDAVARLLATVCPPATCNEWRRDALRRNIRPWDSATIERRKAFGACSLAAIPREVAESFDADARRLEAEVSLLAGSVAERTAGMRVALGDPVWSNGTPSTVGAVVQNQLRAELGRFGFVVGRDPLASDRELVLVLSVESDVVRVAPELRGVADILPLGGLAFSRGLFDISEADLARAASDAALGVDAGVRTGSGGLTVRIDAGARGRAFRNGETFQPRFVASAPARVRVFTVDRAGTAEVLWPAHDADDEVEADTATSIPQLMAIWSDGGQERIVAVAVPVGTSFGALEGWTHWCAVAGAFGPSLYPGSSAVAASTYSVLPPVDRRAEPSAASFHTPPACP